MTSQPFTEPKLGPKIYHQAEPMLSCAVKNTHGRRCHGQPRRVVKIDDGDELMLCERCYDNARAGFYGKISVDLVRDIEPQTAPPL